MTRRYAFGGVICLLAAYGAGAEEIADKCKQGPPILWGDGEHDDYAALVDWAAGKTVRWATTGEIVEAQIEGHTFRLKGEAPFKIFPKGWSRNLGQGKSDGVRVPWDVLASQEEGGRKLHSGFLCSGACHAGPPSKPLDHAHRDKTLPAACFMS